MLTGFGLGATAISTVDAQGKAPGAYAIIDTSIINDADAYKQVGPKAGPINVAAGGRFLALTDNIIGLHGSPPKSFVIIAFDTMEKAKAWDALPAMAEIHTLADKSTTQRRFIVEGK